MKFVKVVKKERDCEKVLINKGAYLTKTWLLAKGLMFTFKIKFPLIFEFKSERVISLHMVFVFYPIDVIFLNSEKKIVDLKENFKPFSFYNSKAKAKYAIEVGNGSIKKYNLQINDLLDFKE